MKVRWGYAKIEFIPLIPDVQRLIELGYCKKHIYDKLHGENKISMAYETFYKLSRKYINIDTKKKNATTKNIAIAHQSKKELPMNTGNLPAVSNSRPPQIIEQEEEAGFGEKQYDNEDLF